MISGKPKLQFWYHRDDEFNLESQFHDRPEMRVINELLDRTIVERESSAKDQTASAYLGQVKRTRDVIAGGPDVLVDPKAERRCGVCRNGYYSSTMPGRVGVGGG